MQDGDPLGLVADEVRQLAEELAADEHLVRVGACRAGDLDTGGALLGHRVVLLAGRHGRGRPLRQSCRVEDRLGDLFGGAFVGGHGHAGHVLVQMAPGVHEFTPLPPRVDGEQRAGGVQPDPPDRLVDVHRQVDDPVAGQEPAGRPVEHGTAAERENARMLGDRVPDRPALQGAEPLLALVEEDLRDRLAGRGHDVRVGVAIRGPEPVGEQFAHGRLTDPHRADQDDQRGAHRIWRWERYDCTLRWVSATLSPPNFSATASASTRATIASATIPAAGTAHTSERW